MIPAFVDGPVQVFAGDALPVLRGMPDESVHCVVTSPPYWGLRDYGTATWDGGDPECDHRGPSLQSAASTLLGNGHGGDKQLSPSLQAQAQPYRDLCGKCGARRIDSQLGLESTPAEYIENMVRLFREVRRVLRSDGTLWLNLGDSYLPGKQLAGMSWRVALALQADGWCLRSDIIWSKPNPMPESVTDRPTKAHEYLFLLSKAPRYYYDADAVREEGAGRTDLGPEIRGRIGPGGPPREGGNALIAGRNLRDVWTIATQPYPEAHFATYPEALVMPCVRAGTSEHGVCGECGAPWRRCVGRTAMVIDRSERTHPMGRTRSSGTMVEPPTATTTGWQPSCAHDAVPVPATVLDPFAGSGTTLAVARRLGRRSIGIELAPSYIDLIRRRVGEAASPLLEEPEPVVANGQVVGEQASIFEIQGVPSDD